MTDIVEKRAPVQGYTGGIPWSMHLKAYDAYCKMYGAQPALIDLEGRGCRGGFGTRELDMFIPGWRDELSEITALRAALAAAEERAEAAEEVAVRLCVERNAAESLVDRFVEACGPFVAVVAEIDTDMPADMRCDDEMAVGDAAHEIVTVGHCRAVAALAADPKGE